MPVTDLLERNHKLYGEEVALVELNPTMEETRKTTWKEFDLVQQTSSTPYRREITWSVFDEKANRVANMLLSRGVQKGDRVAILMFNCLEWLPIYFCILKTGAIAVPFNFRFSADEIQYCVNLAEVNVFFFGPEFIGRIESIEDELNRGRLLIYVGDGCPSFAECYRELTADCSSQPPMIRIEDEDDAAIYFSSGTIAVPTVSSSSSLRLACGYCRCTFTSFFTRSDMLIILIRLIMPSKIRHAPIYRIIYRSCVKRLHRSTIPSAISTRAPSSTRYHLRNRRRFMLMEL